MPWLLDQSLLLLKSQSAFCLLLCCFHPLQFLITFLLHNTCTCLLAYTTLCSPDNRRKQTLQSKSSFPWLSPRGALVTRPSRRMSDECSLFAAEGTKVAPGLSSLQQQAHRWLLRVFVFWSSWGASRWQPELREPGHFSVGITAASCPNYNCTTQTEKPSSFNKDKILSPCFRKRGRTSAPPSF